ALVFVPWAFPGVALALGLLWAYVDFPVPIYATIWILFIGYVTRFLPYGVRTVSSTVIQIHQELEEASKVCGAGYFATFRRILLPLMRPGVITAEWPRSVWRLRWCARCSLRWRRNSPGARRDKAGGSLGSRLAHRPRRCG